MERDSRACTLRTASWLILKVVEIMVSELLNIAHAPLLMIIPTCIPCIHGGLKSC
jgi:hypothetical protein